MAKGGCEQSYLRGLRLASLGWLCGSSRGEVSTAKSEAFPIADDLLLSGAAGESR